MTLETCYQNGEQEKDRWFLKRSKRPLNWSFVLWDNYRPPDEFWSLGLGLCMAIVYYNLSWEYPLFIKKNTQSQVCSHCYLISLKFSCPCPNIIPLMTCKLCHTVAQTQYLQNTRCFSFLMEILLSTEQIKFYIK